MPSSGGYVFTVVSLSAYIRFVYFLSVCFCMNVSAIHYVQSALPAHFFTPTIYDNDEAVPVYREHTQRAAIWLQFLHNTITVIEVAARCISAFYRGFSSQV